MATLTFYVPYNMQYFNLGNPYSAYDATLTSSKVTLYWDPAYQDKTIFYGSFQISGDDVIGGTISSAEDYVNGVKQFNASSLGAYSVNAYKYYATHADRYGFLQDILKYHDSITGSSGADVLGSFTGNDTIFGGGGNDRLIGGSGNDVLNGGSGADTLVGESGNDTYYVDNTADKVFETTSSTGSTDAGGTDTVNSYLPAWTLGLYLENGRILSTGISSLTGNSLANTLYGGIGANTLSGLAGADVLNGLAGADKMLGGAGNDVYYVDNSGDRIYETTTTTNTIDSGGIDLVYSYLPSWSLGLYVENGRILSTATAHMNGNALNNVLYAGVGNNALNGGSGTDTVSYAFGAANSTGVYVSLALSTAQYTGGSGTDTLIGIERLIGSAYADRLAGNAAANVLTGAGGNDLLDGASGNDTMIGGEGSDTYVVRDAGDVVAETNAAASTGGIDTVMSYVGTWILGINVENGRILATGTASLTGNSVANGLSGGQGNNILNGAAGADTLSGGAGNDVLTGGSGRDLLTGGSGFDRFDFNFEDESPANSRVRGAGPDTITDFVRGQDKIDLATIDANTALTGNQAFTTMISSTAAFTMAGQLRVSSGVLYGNTDADSAAEFAIALTGISGLSMSDVIA